MKRGPATLYKTILSLSGICSVGGIFYGAFHHPSLNGGRGGAIAVALAFSSLFVRSTFPSEARKAVAEIAPAFEIAMERLTAELKHESVPIMTEPVSLKQLKDKVSGIDAMLAAKDKDQAELNRYLAAASVIGTLSWGFGDVVAGWVSRH